MTHNVTDNEHAFDTQLQYHTRIGARHHPVTGGGYRFIDSSTTSGSPSFSLTPPDSRNAIVNVFAQDEIALTARLRLTLGSKLSTTPFPGGACNRPRA